MERKTLAAAVFALCGVAGGASAQIARSGGAGAEFAAQLQAVMAERTQLQADNSRLKAKLADALQRLAAAQHQLDATKSTATRSRGELAQLRAANQSAQKSLDAEKSRMQELIGHYRDTVTTLRGVESARAELQKEAGARNVAFDQCAADNRKLYAIATEVLDRYEHQGLWSYLERSEPFTQIKRTQIQNFADEYGARAKDLRTAEPAVPKP